jgi:class 3 adenylate cyclase/tetratricopeptide (TPR) repeat protein
MAELGSWLQSIGLGDQIELFRANGIDLDVAPDLSETELIALGLSLGDRKRLMRGIAALARGDAASASPASPTMSSHGAAERRRLTIMFCDLVGSTDLANRLDPEDVGAVITRYLDTVRKVILRFTGYPVRLLGDGVLIYFGWPHAHEDQVQSAVAAGLDLVDKVGRLEAEPGVHLRCRIGIATGTVVVGEIVGEGGPVDTVVGTAPNLAARLQGEAAPQSVLIDEATVRELGGNFVLEAHPPLQLKGFSEPVRSWSVKAAVPGETRFFARAAARQAMIGRDSELALLHDAWRRAKNGNGRVILVQGEPGIGKSRLLEALVEQIDPATGACLRYQCLPLHSDTPLYPILQQLARALNLRTEDTPQERREKLVAFMAPLFPGQADIIEVFAALLVLPTAAGWTDTKSPAVRRQEIIEALVAMLPRLAARRPLLVLFEDIQWVDPTSEQVIRLAIERLVDAPILLIVTAREPFSPDWFVGSQVGTVSLVRLDREESSALVHGIASEPLAESIVLRIAERADGIPLFLEEMTKCVIEMRSSPLAPAPETDGGLPATLQASLNSRLDHLGLAKRVAQTGAAIGREFSVALLAEVLDKDARDLEPELARLVLSGLAERRGDGGTMMWFKHALVQEAAYASLLLSDRKLLHGRILDGYEKLFRDMLESKAQVLAQHATLAGRWDRGAYYLGLAYANATRRSANREAISIFNRAIEVLGRLPLEVAAPRAIDLRLHAFTAFHTVGANDKLLELIREAERLAELIGDKRRLAAAAVQTAFALWLAGKHTEAQARAEAALTLTKLPDDFPIVVATQFNRANIYHAQGRVAEAVGLLRKVLAMLAGDLDSKRFGWPAPPSVFARAFASWYLLELGEFVDSAKLLDEADLLVSPAEAHGRVMVDTGRGNLLMRRGEFPHAAKVLGATLELCRRAEVLTMYPIVAAWLGHALCGASRVEEALAVMTDAVKRETFKFGGKYTWIHLRLALAEACRLAGQLERAASEAELAYRIADECGEVVHRAYAIFELGRIALVRGDAEGAMRRAESAIEVACSRGLRPFSAECQWLKGQAHEALGQVQAAVLAFDEARHVCAALGLDDRLFFASVIQPRVKAQ